MKGYDWLMAQNYVEQLRGNTPFDPTIRSVFYRRWYHEFGPFGGLRATYFDEHHMMWETRLQSLYDSGADLERENYPYND
jgi:hypothetical protein